MSNFVEADLGKLNKLLKELKSGYFVDVGILEGNTMENGETVAYIGAVHEFGTDKAGRGNNTVIPERSFIKMPIEEKSKEIQKDVELNLAKNLVDGNIKQIFNELGVACDIQIQAAFDSGGFGQWEALKDSTIINKGSNAILIDNGLLRKSISYQVGGGK